MKTIAKIGFAATAGCAIFASAAGDCTDETCANEEAALLQIQKAKSGSLKTAKNKFFGFDWMYATDFVPYFDYTGDLKVKGTVLYTPTANPSDTVNTDGVLLTWALEGLDPECNKGADFALNVNSCGVHIHEGESCTENAGPHYWNDDARGTDPWVCIRYTALKLFHWVKSIMSNVPVLDGWTFDNIEGRTAIIHNYAGGRIACAIIKRPWWHATEESDSSSSSSSSSSSYSSVAPAAQADSLEACVEQGMGDSKNVSPEAIAEQMNTCAAKATPKEVKTSTPRSFGHSQKYCAKDFVQYWEYVVINPKIPDGVVHVTDAGVIGSSLNTALEGQRLSWDLTDLDPECNEGPVSGVANSCGIHIHEATSCEDGVPAGPHYWNQDVLVTDPWACIGYTSYEDDSKWVSKVRSCDAVPVLDGLTLDEVVGHAVLIHNSAGTKVACALIEKC